MALVLADRVLETTTTAGSGTITLAGAEPGYQSFSAVGDGNQTYYTITADTAWEVGIGTYTASGTTLSRDTVLSSSAGGAKVTFPAGIKKVFVTYPAEKSVNFGISGNISASSGVITDVGYPSADSDAATKLYVDTLAAQGITYHTPVKYEVPNTTGNLTATYNNGSSGVGATLTNAGTLTAFVPDGVTASISDRVLVYNQTNGFENGVYTVTVVGSGASSWVLTRATDADTYALKSPNGLGGGDAFYVTSGNTGAGETYLCNNSGVISFGSTAISFVQISAAQVYSAGNGLSLTNTVFSLATPVAVANGGTGSSATPTNGQLLIGNGSNFTLSTLTAGSGVSITNSAGSITLSATGLGGTVTAVTASSPLASSGGTAPNISIANSTGTGSVVLQNDAAIFSATITNAVSASITTLTGSSANITTVTGTTAGFSSANITHAGITSATITTLSGTNVTYSSGTVSQLAATSATITNVSGTNVTYTNGTFTSATVTNLNSTSANITTLTGTTFGTTATTHLKGISGTITTLTGTSADITTITGTTIGTTASATIRGVSGAITTISGTTATYTSATVTNLALTSLTLANLSITSANVTTLTGTNLTYTSGTVTNLNSTSANITTLTGTTFGTTATTQLRGASADITTLTGTTFGTTATTQLRGASGAITTLTGTSSNYTNATVTSLTLTRVSTFQINKQNTTGEGGEFYLEKSDTSTLAGNLVIDLVGNSLRFFENGGTARGTTLDISTQAAGASSVLVTSSNVGSYALPAKTPANWSTAPSVIGNVVGLMAWKNYGNNHVIFDASASTSPAGGAVNNTNPDAAWTGSYPTLMGWNGSNTYGVRVDSCRTADNGIPTVNVTSSTSIAATTNNHYILRGGATTVTLPASPSAGNFVWVTVANGRSDNVIARNGQNIQGLAENMTLNAPYAAVQLRFSDATMGWVFC